MYAIRSYYDYDQIDEVGRDQGLTFQALQALP